MKDKIKKIINCGLKVNICNLRCHYCYVGQLEGYSTENPDLPHDIKKIRKALSKKRMGGTCLINLCGAGETMLSPFIFELTRNLLEEGHYVTLVTNGTISKKIDEFMNLPKHLRKHLFIKFSFHFLELKRLNLLDVYFENIHKVQRAGISMTVELTANDESIPFIPEIKKCCEENLGAWCHIIESRDDTTNELKRLTCLDEKEHLKKWEAFNSELISFQKTTWGIHRKEFCYAGDWLYNIDLWSGDVSICLKFGKKIGNIYDNLEGEFHGVAIGMNCPWEHCFSSYFLLTNGVIPELNTPTYAQLRDRVDIYGNHWLNKKVNDFFGSKLVESNEIYTTEKKKLINALMGTVYDSNKGTIDFVYLASAIKSYMESAKIKCFTLVFEENMELSLFDFAMRLFDESIVQRRIVFIKDETEIGLLMDKDTVYVVVNYLRVGKYSEFLASNKIRMIPISEVLG